MLVNGVPSSKGFVFPSEGNPAVVVAQGVKFIIQLGGGEVKVPTEPGRTSTHLGIDVGPKTGFHIRAKKVGGERAKGDFVIFLRGAVNR